MRLLHRLPLPLPLIFLALWLAGAAQARAQAGEGSIELTTCVIPGTDEEARCGTYTVYENRAARSGRTIDLNIMVLPAGGTNPHPDPVFWLAGGPGLGATRVAGGIRRAWFREERDIVLVDQRGTGESNPLDCDVAPGGDDNLQAYLDPAFRAEVFEACLEQLEKIADLTQYTTPIAMDDLNDIRAALGFDIINVMGGSYGSRAALVYMRRHAETVRSAILNGVAPIAFRNPLYHAYEAQRALQLTFKECAEDKACQEAFPDLQQEFDEVMTRLEKEPASVVFSDEDSGEEVELEMSRYAFAEALRTTMYSAQGARDVPLLIHRAYEGDYEFFIDVGLQTNRAIVDILQFGMLLSVTCPEDLARIDPEEIPALTGGTFMGSDRVRNQLAVCQIWPKGAVPDDYGEPVSVDVPTLVLSGTNDPVTAARWGEEAASHLPNSLHVVAPGAHGVGGPCIRSIEMEFLETASVKGLDTSCVADMKLPPFKLTADGGASG